MGKARAASDGGGKKKEFSPNGGWRIQRKARRSSTAKAGNFSQSCKGEAPRNSNKMMAAKERKERRDKSLCCLFFAIYAFACGHFIWAAVGRATHLSLFAANQLKCLTMNHLHANLGFSGQAQSRLVKPNKPN